MAITLRFDPRDPSEISPYTLDLINDPAGPWLVAPETLVSASVASIPPDLSVLSVSPQPSYATAWLSGGVIGTDYQLAFKLTTSTGRVATRSGMCFCENR